MQSQKLDSNIIEYQQPEWNISFPCFDNMSSLTGISTPVNQFYNSLPPNMFHTLPNLQVLAIGGNQISGPIPPSITNASFLVLVDISGNLFTDQVSKSRKATRSSTNIF